MSIQSERQPNACVAFPSVFDRPHHMVVDITYRSPVIYSVTYLGRKANICSIVTFIFAFILAIELPRISAQFS